MWSDWSAWSGCTKNRSRPDSFCSTEEPMDACPMEMEVDECETIAGDFDMILIWFWFWYGSHIFDKSTLAIQAIELIPFLSSESKGEWHQWGDWSSCTSTCGNGLAVRRRTCRDETTQCFGDSTEAKDCLLDKCSGILLRNFLIAQSLHFTVPVTEWEHWGEWSQCSASCGPGVEFRARSCSKPVPGGNETCPGNATEAKGCNMADCPGWSP